MEIKWTKLQYPTINLQMTDATCLRGYFANKYIDHDILHNHTSKGYSYRYPLVQYKLIDGIPTIIGLQLGADEVVNLGLAEELISIANSKYMIDNVTIETNYTEIGLTSKPYEYKFITPWLALNQENISKYKNIVDSDTLLRHILIQNIIQFAKSSQYQVPDTIIVEFDDIVEVETHLKGVSMLGFMGSFKVNFKLPDLVGLGKSASRGFGTITKKVKLL
ncbi:MAG: CRISPR-associated endonuclease Cas6 [Methanogenium sp.]|jgi:hypothetical protein